MKCGETRDQVFDVPFLATMILDRFYASAPESSFDWERLAQIQLLRRKTRTASNQSANKGQTRIETPESQI